MLLGIRRCLERQSPIILFVVSYKRAKIFLVFFFFLTAAVFTLWDPISDDECRDRQKKIRNMKELSENVYNQRAGRDQPKLKLWRYAGLLLTYKCTAECRFCYYRCSPDKGGLMSVDMAMKAWEGLRRLAADSARIHITGGEPFMYFQRLLEIVTRAKALGLTGLDSIETNGYWATDEKLICDRIGLLASAGMHRLKISWDPFHAEFIDSAKIELLVKVASKLLGADRVLLRWQKYMENPIDMRQLSEKQRFDAFRSAIQDYPCRFTGRATGKVAQLFADKTVKQLATQNCKKAYLSAKGVHIDPYGNIFSGLCSGISIGDINKCDLDELWKRFDPGKQGFVGGLFADGPCGSLSKAAKGGYQARPLYADKCHLCTEVRHFYFDNNLQKTIIGPADCYT